MQIWCVGCHNSASSGGGFNLSDYNGVITAISNNKLLGSIKHQSGFIAMPQNAAQISQCEIAAIEKWVINGHPN